MLWLSSLITSRPRYYEKGQACSQANQSGVFGKEVIVQAQSEGEYGRTIADVLLPDGTHVNHELVRDSWRWRKQYREGPKAMEIFT